jgi:hypothetical protein
LQYAGENHDIRNTFDDRVVDTAVEAQRLGCEAFAADFRNMVCSTILQRNMKRWRETAYIDGRLNPASRQNRVPLGDRRIGLMQEGGSDRARAWSRYRSPCRAGGAAGKGSTIPTSVMFGNPPSTRAWLVPIAPAPITPYPHGAAGVR